MHFSKKLYLLVLINVLIVLHPFTISASDERKEPETADVIRFQWVPSFNFIFKGRAAEDDGYFARLTNPEIKYDSPILSRWHQEQISELKRSYRAVASTIFRNVATVMLSLVYVQEDRLLIRNLPIPVLFLSGFAKSDSPIQEHKLVRRAVCVGELYSASPSSAYPAYLADLIQLFRGGIHEGKYQADRYMKNEDTSPRTTPSKTFKASECHSERGIAIYLRDNLLNDTPISHALLEDIDPKKGPIIGLIINIASYLDMCRSCQGTFVQELTHGNLFLNMLRDYWKQRFKFNKDFAIAVAQSGVKEYKEESTRRRVVPFKRDDIVRFETIKDCVIHMENK